MYFWKYFWPLQLNLNIYIHKQRYFIKINSKVCGNRGPYGNGQDQLEKFCIFGAPVNLDGPQNS